MSTSIVEKKYTAEARFCNFYTGGDVVWTKDGSTLYCLNSTEIAVVDIASGQVKQTYSVNSSDKSSKNNNNNNKNDDGKANTGETLEDEDNVYTFALSPNNDYLCTAHRSGLLRLWSLTTNKVQKLWKGQHKGPILKVQFSPCGRLVCTSGADSSLRIWDYINNSCLCVLRGYPGPALLIKFHPNKETREIYAVGADNTIYSWNHEEKVQLRQLRGHLSQVTALSFQTDSADCEYIASSGRDKVLIIWKLEPEGAGKQYKVIPMYEELEGVCFVSQLKETNNVYVACANGQLKMVNIHTAKISNILNDTNFEVRQLHYCREQQQLALVTAEHNILIYGLPEESGEAKDLKCFKQLIGFNDEILDICYLGDDDRFLAVATNSKDIKVYDTANNMNCQILTGHKETVISLAASGGTQNFLLSAGKDYSIKLWKLQTEPEVSLKCVAENASSHTSSIGCVAFGFNTHLSFASVCQDGSMKVWNLQRNKQDRSYSFNVKYAVLAHEKEINCVTFSPNNKLIATASLDKTCKLWNAEKQASMGTLRGHTRGVWCVRFSPVDQILLTTSSDCSMRIWSLANLSCLKRLDQESTVLRAEFIDNGKYIVSAASDGLLKVWNIKTNTCVQTLDEHESRIWTLAVSQRSKKYFFSGGADSALIRWEDITTQTRNEEIDKRQELLQQEQTLQTLLQQEKHTQKAFHLALTLGKPKVTYNIVSQYVRKRETEKVKDLIANLNSDQLNSLLEHVKGWGTNSRFSRVSNLILHYILADLLANPKQRTYNTRNLVEVVLPYVQRHFKRVNELHKDLAFLEFLVMTI